MAVSARSSRKEGEQAPGVWLRCTEDNSWGGGRSDRHVPTPFPASQPVKCGRGPSDACIRITGTLVKSPIPGPTPGL